MKKVVLVVEENSDLLEGYVEGVKSDALISASGYSLEELTNNIRMLIEDYQQNEGIDDKAWQKINAKTVEFDVRYNLAAFFTEHDYLKASVIAKKAHLNAKLLSHYMTGDKHPSEIQVKKIETAVRKIGEELLNVSLVAG